MEIFSSSLVGASGINADALYISIDQRVFAVMDGASGAFDKRATGRACLAALTQHTYNSASQPAPAHIRACFEHANARLIEQSRRDDRLSFGTMTMAVLDSGRLTLGAVGDTAAFLISADSARRLVQPGKLYMRAVEQQAITVEQAEQAVAALPAPLQSCFETFLPMVVLEVATTTCLVRAGDVLLICTDGISDWVRPEEFPAVLRAHAPLGQTCAQLIAMVQERCPSNRRDDATLVAVRFS